MSEHKLIELGRGEVVIGIAVSDETQTPLLTFTVFDVPREHLVGQPFPDRAGANLWDCPNAHVVAISIPKLSSAIVILEKLTEICVHLSGLPKLQPQEPHEKD